jgi:hypothetical protein
VKRAFACRSARAALLLEIRKERLEPAIELAAESNVHFSEAFILEFELTEKSAVCEGILGCGLQPRGQRRMRPAEQQVGQPIDYPS